MSRHISILSAVFTLSFAVACVEEDTALYRPATEGDDIADLLDADSKGTAFDGQCGALPGAPFRLAVPNHPDRTAWVVPPAGAGVRDAVVVLHAEGGTPLSIARRTQFHHVAPERGLLAVFPEAVDGMWHHEADGHEVDDVKFLSALSDALSDQLCADRVMVAGFDRGGMMAQRLACEGTGADAVVSVAGPRLAGTCDGPATPILLAHGLEDRVMPYDGSETWPSAEDTADSWIDHNGWDGQDPRVRDFGAYNCLVYAGDAFTTECAVKGLGHSWPGGLLTPNRPGIDLTVQSLEWLDRVLPR